MEEYNKIEECKKLIIDSLPQGFKKYLNDPLVYHYVETMARRGTLNVGNLLVAVLQSREEIMEKFKHHLAWGTPQYFVGTQEMIDKLKAEHEAKKTQNK